MRRKNIVLNKVIAISIVFLLAFADFLPIASNFVLAAEDDANVEFVGYFSTEEMDNTTSIVCDVQESTLKINFEIKVHDKGYLKNGIITFPNDLNFSISDENEGIVEDNRIKIRQIDKDKSELITIPIAFERLDEFNSNYVRKINNFVFSGIYVDNEGVEHEITKSANLELAWNEKTSTKINSEIVKNLDYTIDEGTNGKIVQAKVTISGNEEKNDLPIKEEELRIDVPVIAGMELTSVKVTSDKLAYTQGREDYNIDFSDENYRLEGNKLIINVRNDEKDGKITNSYGEDVYTITYMYSGIKQTNDLINGNIELLVKNWCDEEEVQNIQVEYNLNDAIGNLVQYTREDKESEISKGYLMANSDADKYEITYTKRDVLSISRADLVESLLISDTDEYFVENGDAHIYYTEEDGIIRSSYKYTEFSRENLINVLGEDGKIEILNMNDEVISTITFDLEADENGIYRIEYNEPISKIKIRISKPITDGNISVLSTKAIKKLDYSRNLIKDFYKLVSSSEATVTYTEGIVDSLGSVQSVILVNQTSSNAVLEMSKTELSTTVINEGVNFKIRLNNNDDTSDLYENPVFEVKLPTAIEDVTVKNIDLFYANDELQIANVETLESNGQKVIRITLSGMQTSYNLNKETNGTVISFDLDLKLKEFTTNGQENVCMYYYNASSTSYVNEVDWAMMLGLDGVTYFKNGISEVSLTYKAPEGLVNAQTTETKQEETETVVEGNDDKVTSIKQGAQSELIEENAPAKLATMSIAIMNNTNKRYYDFQILGRIPFIGNKDITTGEDLGTTVDTILSSAVSSNNSDLPYTVYYSENGEATTDLSDESNGWSTDYYKTGGIKSYLIVLSEDYILEPNTSLEFTYDYMIPAGLSAGDAFFGTYATYYKEESGDSANSSADKIGYETEKNTNIEASINLVDGKLKELSDAEYEIILKNNTDVDAKDLSIVFDIPQEFIVVNIEGNNVSGTEEEKKITINVPEVKAGSEEKVIARFYVNTFEAEENKVKLLLNINGENLTEGLNIETGDIGVEKTKVMINDTYYQYLKVAGNNYQNSFFMSNVSDKEYKNVKITKRFGEAFEFVGSEISSVVSNSHEVSEFLKESNGELNEEQLEELREISTRNEKLNVMENYDQATKTVTWEIENFKPGDEIEIKYNTYIRIMTEAREINTDIIYTECDLNDSTSIIKNEEKIEYNQSKIDIKSANNYNVGYAIRGEEITYEWEIINNNDYDVTDFQISPEISDNATITGIRFENSFIQQDYFVSDENTIFAYLPANSVSQFIVKAKSNENATGFISSSVKANYDEVYSDEKNVYTVLENDSDELHEMMGIAYVDKNRNQVFDADEEVLQGIVVNLFNSETNELVDSKITDISGRYIFRNLVDGAYYVKFNYDDSEYLVSSEKSENLLTDKLDIININNNCITDNLIISGRGISNVDLPLVNDEIFDMKVDAHVEKMIVQNSLESNEFIPENKNLAKVDIDPELLFESKVLVEYKITVKNQGTIPGTVEKLVDYIPSDMEFDSSLNSDWYIENDGNIYTTALENEVINPGESRDLKLVLIKNMTEENTGLVHNSVEIADASNDRGIDDIDSIPNNQLDEDDLASMDCIIGITTGFSISVIPIIVISIVVIVPIAFLVWRIIEKRQYV